MTSRFAWMQRPLAVLMVSIFALAAPAKFVDYAAIGGLLAHYLLAFWFHPWAKVKNAGVLAPHIFLIGILALVALLQNFYQFPHIILFFGMHFVLTEMYERKQAEESVVKLARAIYYAAAYLCFMKFNLGLGEIGFPLLAAAAVALAFLLVKLRSWKQAIRELAFFIPIVLTFREPTRFNYILLYHVAIWWAIPLLNPSGVTKKYVRDSALVTGIFLALVFISCAWQESLYWAWNRETMRLGYIHVAISLVMSSSNPLFVRTAALRAQGFFRNVL